MNDGSGEVIVPVEGIVSKSEIEVEVSKDVFEDKDGDFVLSEHGEDGSVSNSDIVSKGASGIDDEVFLFGVDMENVVETGCCWISGPVDHDHTVMISR